jgi:hypothetical protein
VHTAKYPLNDFQSLDDLDADRVLDWAIVVP